MENIIGLDLGSNSIGWAIRDLSVSGNQIIDKGILTFEKGVGEEKGQEYPMVQKRTESRGKRRNYQAEKYRKWNLLEYLIEKGLCPLRMDELNEWRHYSKGIGRKYPQSEKFIQWLRFDFDGDGRPDFHLFGADKHESYYLFRALIVSENEQHREIFQRNPHIIGRIFYQLVQRRGYRGRDDEDEEAKTILKGSEKNGTHGHDAIAPFIEEHKTLGAALYFMQKENKERIRKRYNLRTDLEQELKEICRVCNFTENDYARIAKSLIWQRPLRSQKGLIGICTFEKNKPRCPISHPIYEEFRTWVFINNLKIDLPEDIDREKYLHDEIYPLFYNASRDFKLTTIAKKLKKVNGTITARFQDDTKVVSCSLLNSFEKLFGENWKNEYGWFEVLQNKPKNCSYSFEDIWHVLSTFDSKEKLVEFGIQKLKLEEEKAEKFAKIRLQQGYATLSLAAIKKILRYLQQGFIYSEAVYLANLHKVMGENEISRDLAKAFANMASEIMAEHKTDIDKANVVNDLISQQLNSEFRFGMDANYQLDDADKRDISSKIYNVFGEKTWQEKFCEQERNKIYQSIEKQYLDFLRKPFNAKKEALFVKPNRLHDKLFNFLHEAYGVPLENKKYLWHPSEQETYPEAIIFQKFTSDETDYYIPIDKIENFLENYPNARDEGFTTKLLGEPRPISNGFKNPMALRTLHELKKLLNYLLKTEKIDEGTRVVVEIARELNDANMRKAIETWQRQREKENDNYKAKIKEIADANPNLRIDENDKELIAKYRLWEEQSNQCIYTGRTINCKELFDGSRYNFEHTIPASMSFDNELKNLTIAEIDYNMNIKGKKIPSECPNYENDYTQNGVKYTAIKPRLNFMEEKVDHLEKLLDEWILKTKFASTKDIKDACIQHRHLIKFELDYWRKKLGTFTCKEYKAGWRNSQLKDTQIVSKYALPYLKTIFKKVEVQKGNITADFRKIYNIQPRLEKKDREIHSHHAIDAAVLTLIPTAPVRDKILLNYNEDKDNNLHAVHHEQIKDWQNFNASYILSIKDEVLINYQPNHNTLVPAIKKVRKRGRQQFVKYKDDNGKWHYKLNELGNKVQLIAKGDTIRGQLHKESYFGAVKLNDEICLVERYPIASFSSMKDCKHIVDNTIKEIVQKTLEQRIDSGKTFDQAKLEPISFPSGKALIKKVRCKVAAGRGYLTTAKAIPVKKHTFLSDKEYKRYIYAQNEENTLCLYYEQKVDNNVGRAFRIVGLYELSQLKLNSFEQIRNENYYKSATLGSGKNKYEIPINHIIKVGTKVIFYKEHINELIDLSKIDLLKRVFRVYKFNETGAPLIYLQNHLEARPNDKLGNGDNSFDPTKYQARLYMVASNFRCAIEERDFEIKPDGEIVFYSSPKQ